jgi:REP element-mobilizing transposase RayT
MPSYTCNLYHVVFGTKARRPTLRSPAQRDFLAYCCGIIEGMECRVHRINCVDDHIHILVGLHPTIDIARFVKNFKIASGKWLRAHPAFPDFDHWQEKYGAFTVGWSGREDVIRYIRNQQEHHRVESSSEEFRRIIREAGLEWDERDGP